ncbi:DNA topoisomerase I [Candidatus Thiomargarita nelsonii]|uniref:DNA topoisomerase 1 n=1 Tax=Candidatus Thiomargarita nelsonii TaxID=1003181 RepID=A0A0A6PH49_9GAMM|nr:DNA topoisomerase I [Candidatus Thiomargarita nelsonii]
MVSKLVVVESPAKAKTIEKYLGKDFKVLASFGHVRELPRKNGAVDTAHDFAMEYQLIKRNAKHVEAIAAAAQRADTVYLASDPDREGEAISWHLYEILKDRQIIQNKTVYRVAFHEITQHAIQDAIANPTQLSMNLVNAQRARLALDYLVGFNLSPVLWRKIRSGLSAGRVQSPALRLIVERDQEIDKFKPREYWTVEATCDKKQRKLTGKLNSFEGEKITQFSVTNEEQATQIKTTLLQLADGKLQVTKVDKKQRKRQPSAPFTTSTLQQEAARKLGFTTKRTMQVAQQLYEGIDIGNGAVGLITYMRTDSVNLGTDAIAEIREVISERYGKDNLPEKPCQYKTKAKNAQEAHEAIRPTSPKCIPSDITKFLKPEQLKLYTLIWNRTIACQMIHATLDTVGVNLACGEGNIFRATGSTLVNPGFMAVYQEGIDDKKGDDEDDKMLPPLEVGEWIKLKDIRTDQHFTEPPPRFSEASLVKNLEEFGIGRPSTYASIISTLQQREYVVLEKKRFIATDTGRVVIKLLTGHFSRYVDYDFTAKLEDQLDAISRGEQEWVPLMHKFWDKFKALVDEKMQTVQRKDITTEELDEACPKCSKPLAKRLSKRGHFIGCTGYPDCDYTRNLEGGNETSVEATTPEVVEGRTCPECDSKLHIKPGRYSKFIGCSNYPKCKFQEPLEKQVDTGVQCPNCGKGTLTKKKSRYGNFFYSCSSYPTCKYAISNEPIAGPCPKCDWPILMLKTTKRRGTEKLCPQKACDYVEQVEATKS